MGASYIVPGHSLTAFSIEQGIVISTTAFRDVQKKSILVYRNPQGNVSTEIYNHSIGITENFLFDIDSSQKDFIHNSVPGITCAIYLISILLSFLIRNSVFSVGISAFWILMEATSGRHNLAWYIADAIYHKRHRKLGKYHAAEHMALAAYEKVKRVPSAREIRHEDMYDSRCSTVSSFIKPLLFTVSNSLIITFMILFLLWVIQIMVASGNSWIIASILPGVMFYVFLCKLILVQVQDYIQKNLDSKGWLLRITQSVFLEKPSIREIEVAQEAVKQRQFLDCQIRNSIDDYLTNCVYFNPKDNETIFVLVNGEELKSTIDEYTAWIQAFQKATIVDNDDIRCTDG